MRTIIKDIPDEVKEFISMPSCVEKNFLYYKKFNGCYDTSNFLRKDGKIHYSECSFQVKKNGEKYWLSTTGRKNGFTLGKSLTFWFNGSPTILYNSLPVIMKYFGVDWWEEKLFSFLTKGGLERVLNGKITNPIDFLKHYVKYSRLKVSPVFLYRAIKHHNLNKTNFLRMAYVAKDANHLLEKYMQNDIPSIIDDCIQQCNILNKKIDYNWSEKRLMEEHNSWTKELMELEISTIEDEIVPNIDKLSGFPPEFELLTTKKRIFQEGSEMHHCIYTNYYEQIKKNNYLVFHVQLGMEEATLGLNWWDELSFNQLYRAYNKSVSEEMLSLCKNWVANNKDNYKKSLILKTNNNEKCNSFNNAPY